MFRFAQGPSKFWLSKFAASSFGQSIVQRVRLYYRLYPFVKWACIRMYVHKSIFMLEIETTKTAIDYSIHVCHSSILSAFYFLFIARQRDYGNAKTAKIGKFS